MFSFFGGYLFNSCCVYRWAALRVRRWAAVSPGWTDAPGSCGVSSAYRETATHCWASRPLQRTVNQSEIRTAPHRTKTKQNLGQSRPSALGGDVVVLFSGCSVSWKVLKSTGKSVKSIKKYIRNHPGVTSSINIFAHILLGYIITRTKPNQNTISLNKARGKKVFDWQDTL